MKRLVCLMCKRPFFADADSTLACCTRCSTTDKGKAIQQSHDAQLQGRIDRLSREGK